MHYIIVMNSCQQIFIKFLLIFMKNIKYTFINIYYTIIDFSTKAGCNIIYYIYYIHTFALKSIRGHKEGEYMRYNGDYIQFMILRGG